MRHKSFGEFVDKKKRESIRQLGLVKQMLEQSGMKVENFLESDEDYHDPYIFCHNPSKTGSFDGIRIYKIGTDLAFRVQKENKTHPFGSAYPLPIESMFYDFLSDQGVDENKAAQKIKEAVSKEVRRFFDKSNQAEKDHRQGDIEKDGAGLSLVRTTGTDYSATVTNKSS
jgi:hypothetical protein